ncbi:pilin [Paraferrimonas haliotis]|uniref:Prepilin-type N-terminal cleavage/methylation domain-containing protein n=1 Tax=Paraferrimonas haliotis TaxID=2013866 RepID=A0AA37TJD6_9GAMM|nr:pilin [Paraferrimonas haliotis]GLS82259.1 prepilin-type N-terminal cleavage/methylation domain-containing protein [Paraferrimonas haliotis]
MKQNKGFTLIELLIVVAIIGILAAVAIPQYQNYIAKAEVTRGYSSVAALKTPIEAYILENGSFPAGDDALALVGANTGLVQNAVLSNSGTALTLTFNKDGNSPAVGEKALTLTRSVPKPNEPSVWACEYSGDQQHKPNGCQLPTPTPPTTP